MSSRSGWLWFIKTRTDHEFESFNIRVLIRFLESIFFCVFCRAEVEKPNVSSWRQFNCGVNPSTLLFTMDREHRHAILLTTRLHRTSVKIDRKESHMHTGARILVREILQVLMCGICGKLSLIKKNTRQRDVKPQEVHLTDAGWEFFQVSLANVALFDLKLRVEVQWVFVSTRWH